MEDDTHTPIIRPRPRRPFETDPDTSYFTSPTTPRTNDFAQQLEARLQRSRNGESAPESEAPSRARSFVNLTASTLFGIYSPTGGYEASEPATPWGTGAETPARRESMAPSPSMAQKEFFQELPRAASPAESLLRLVVRVIALFAFGLIYGVSIQQLHKHGQMHLTPVNVEGVDRASWRYYGGWGIASISLGLLLPMLDAAWGQSSNSVNRYDNEKSRSEEEVRVSTRTDGGEWNHIVRSIGVFVGIAFAIRKLPWRSTLQVSVTLALVNPMLWYIVDRTRTGFVLSALVGIVGTIAMMGINPGIVPTPAAHESGFMGLWNATNSGKGSGSGADELIAGLFSYEDLGLATWLASVFFCSAVCFGNIGRRLVGNDGRGS